MASTYMSALKSQTLTALGPSAASSKLAPATGSAGDLSASQLIDSKFNELSRKILDELKQVQYSRDFFQAVDDILREPIAREFTRIYQQQTHLNQQRHSKQQHLLQQQQKRRLQSLNSDNSQSLFQREPLARQPRSLPTEVARQQPADVARNNQTTQTDLRLSQPAAEATGKQPATSSFPLGKSATFGDAQLAARRQLNAVKCPSPSSYARQQQLLEARRQPEANKQTLDRFYRKQRNHSAGSISRIVASYEEPDGDDDDDDDEEEEDDDDDDEQEDDNNQAEGFSRTQRLAATFGKQPDKSRASHPAQRFSSNPTAKSNPSSGAGTTAEFVSAAQRQPDSSQMREQQARGQRQRFGNPIVRSSTISGAQGNLRVSQQPARTDSAEPRSMNLLSHKDIGFFYKPHMNYSTSLLGTHRLSDDDEIIIIPTQSPSLMSTSPEGESQAAEIQTEGFSISRTKSFWEKLSKGNRLDNKPSSPTGCPSQENNESAGTGPAPTTKPGGQRSSSNRAGGSKVVGVRANGHSHGFDRMDSTGGSNSNYSCSSSGDENNCSSSNSHQKQQNSSGASQTQEMSRQNILRQTR